MYNRRRQEAKIPVYGYPNGAANLGGASAGDVVLAYINQEGIRGADVVLDPNLKAGTGVFIDAEGKQLPDEYNLPVRW
jgi:hypothetical protein